MKAVKLIITWWWLILMLLFSLVILYFIWHSQLQVNTIDKELNRPSPPYKTNKTTS